MTHGESFVRLGQFLIEHPEFETTLPTTRLNFVATGEGQLESLAKSFGECKKVVDDNYFILRKQFGTVEVDLFTYREQICERVKVGEKEVPEQIVPAREEEIVPAHTEPIYEWKCPDSLLSG